MQKKHEILLTLEVNHEFYEDNIINVLEIIPHPVTEKFLKNYRLLLKKSGLKWLVLQEWRFDGSDWKPLIKIEETQPIIFQFRFNDSLFQNKTDIDFFANKDKKLSIRMKNDELGTMKLLPFQQKFIAIDNYESKVVADFKILTCFEKESSNLRLSSNKEGVLVFDFPVEYKILKNGNILSEGIYSDYDNQFDGYFFFGISQESNQKFQFKFEARELYWKFIIVPKYYDFEEGLSFHEESNQITFDFESDKETGNFVFTSKEKIKLRPYYDFSFFLKKEGEKIVQNIGSPSVTKLARCSKVVSKLMLEHYVQM